MSRRRDATAARALSGLRAPDEAGAEERAWTTVKAAYADRPPAAAARRRGRVLGVPLVAALLAAVALSPAGATVKRIINRAFAAPPIARMTALSLPAAGRVLVSSDRGTWVVSPGGATRRLGAWTQGSWSPRGLYLAVASADSLAAVNPAGAVAWQLPVRGAGDPRWYMPSGYRVAYRVGGDLREIAGDGRGDHLVARHVAPIAPAWRPGHDFQLAYVTGGGVVVVRDGDSGATVWRSHSHPGRPVELSWSPSGTRLLLITSAGAWLDLPGQSPPLSLRLAVRGPIVAASSSPDGRHVALVRGGRAPQLELADLTAPERPAHTVVGIAVDQPTWSPDSHWLLVSQPAAGSWLFVRVTRRPRILAVSRVAARFGGPHAGAIRIEGWCCAP